MSDIETTGFWATLFVVSDWPIRLAILPIVPTPRSPEAPKGWLLFIFFVPWLGLALYLLIGRPRVPRWRTARFREFMHRIEPVRERLRDDPLLVPAVVTPQFEPSVRLATDAGMLPNFGRNAVELLTDYDGTFARMVRDIDSASIDVHLCFYIFASDARTAPVIEALGRAVRRGVSCRVPVDAFGSRPRIPTLLPVLRSLGVDARVALPVRVGRKAARFDLRNHRKLVVVDGRVGYTG
jgi:cardiolipin synthase